MNLIDLSFLLYALPILLVIYFVLSFSRKAQNLWLAISFLVLYSFGNIGHMALLFVMAMANYYFGSVASMLHKKGEKATRLLIIAIVVNLLPLFFYRYLESILNIFSIGGISFPAVPLGISFLALQGISYVVDISRGDAAWHVRFSDSLVYLVFFPTMQAGPLLQYKDIEPQIIDRKIHFDNIAEGLGKLVIGLGKVILLGNTLLSIGDIVFEQSNNSGIYTTVPISLALLGLLALAMGLYYYFSGFSDIAIGFGRMIGFSLPENFDTPILASSMTSFWKRSYSSLGKWFDSYLYQPFQNKHSSNDRMVYHLLLLWVVIGLWVGPGIPKIIFGLLSFLCILVERIVEVDKDKKESKNPLRYVYVLFIMLISIIALRTDTTYQFTLFIGNLFGMRGNGFTSGLALSLLKESWYIFAVGFICLFPIGKKIKMLAEKKGSVIGKALYVLYPIFMLGIIILVLLVLSSASYEPSQVLRLHLWR